MKLFKLILVLVLSVAYTSVAAQQANNNTVKAVPQNGISKQSPSPKAKVILPSTEILSQEERRTQRQESNGIVQQVEIAAINSNSSKESAVAIQKNSLSILEAKIDHSKIPTLNNK